LELWTTVLLPELDAMVRPGGPCEGAEVVHQEDNAGPHIDKVYKQWLQDQFDVRGWKLEHQAPQGPYTNVLLGLTNVPSHEQAAFGTLTDVF
jgi:hypothetical protein